MGTVHTRLVPVTPVLQAGIDVVLIGVDKGAGRDARLDEGPDRRLPDVGQHVQHDFAAALDQAEDRRPLLGQRAPAGRALEPAAPPKATFLATAAGWPLCPATT